MENLTKKQIQHIYKNLQEDHWGDIDSSWFEYIDFELGTATQKYSSDHIDFQKLLQGLK